LNLTSLSAFLPAVTTPWDEETLEPITEVMRRVPKQPRSLKRVLNVLDAGDQLLASEGADALTTTRIAELAEISVGSLYQYFPDRDTIIEALATAYWGDLLDLVEAVAEAEELEPSGDATGAIIDALAAGFRARPGFLALWYGGLRTERVRDATRPVRVLVGRSVDRVLTVTWPKAPAARRATVARMLVLAGDGLMREAFRLDRDGDETILAESKRMLNAYIVDSLGSPESA
jgi:AcrR family transcriptional regulator